MTCMHNAYGETEGEWLSSIALRFGSEVEPLTNSVRAAYRKVSGILSFFHSAGITGTHHCIQLFLGGRQGQLFVSVGEWYEKSKSEQYYRYHNFQILSGES